MSDLISREALLKRMNRRLDILRKEYGLYDHYTDGYDEAIDHVMDFPAADAEPVRHGRWMFEFALDNSNFYRCSECNRQEVLLAKESINEWCPYCHCGAKMGGAEDD